MTATSLADRSGQRAQFQVVPMAAPLGAEIRGIDLKRLDDATFKALHETWLNHVLVVFRGQSMAAEDLVHLIRRFGTPVTSSNLHQRSLDERAGNRLYHLPPEVTIVSNVREGDQSIGILGEGEVVGPSIFPSRSGPPRRACWSPWKSRRGISAATPFS